LRREKRRKDVDLQPFKIMVPLNPGENGAEEEQ
jgi:hypothetical protein